jgi:tRNA(Ile)-lysidine synthase
VSAPGPIARAAPPPSPDLPLSLAGSRGEGRFRLGGVALQVRWRPADPSAPARGALSATLALEPGQFPLLLRARRPGDRVRTAAGTRTLKRLLNDRRVPLSQRARVPVLADAQGRVLWVAGHVQGAPAPRPGEPGVTLEIDDA